MRRGLEQRQTSSVTSIGPGMLSKVCGLCGVEMNETYSNNLCGSWTNLLVAAMFEIWRMKRSGRKNMNGKRNCQWMDDVRN